MNNEWTSKKKSTLIESVLNGTFVSSIAVDPANEDSIKSSLHIMIVLNEFFNNGFELPQIATPVIIKGQAYKVAGKTFSELDSVLQNVIISTQETGIQLFEKGEISDGIHS